MMKSFVIVRCSVFTFVVAPTVTFQPIFTHTFCLLYFLSPSVFPLVQLVIVKIAFIFVRTARTPIFPVIIDR